MNRLIYIFATVYIAFGYEYNGLRAKFGWSDALANKEYFFDIPRTIPDAEAAGWKRTDMPDTRMPDLRLYCPDGRQLCAMYDITGFVAGVQVNVNKEEYVTHPINPDKKFLNWRARKTDTEPSGTYWMQSQFFVSEDSQKAGAGPTVENGATLQDGGIWILDLQGQPMRIPTTEAELNATLFKKQNCIPNMGTHYYYNMTPAMECEKYLPWFVLVSKGQVIGTGFQVFGKLTREEEPPQKWFELIPAAKQSAQVTIPRAPTCLYKWAASYGVISLHIYYIDKPWEIRCSEGDSIQPAPAMDRFLLNTYRYASKISDEFKRIFSFY